MRNWIRRKLNIFLTSQLHLTSMYKEMYDKYECMNTVNTNIYIEDARTIQPLKHDRGK